MVRLILLGATGSLGRHVLGQALSAGHEVTVLVRTPSKLPAEVQSRVSTHAGDLSVMSPADLGRLVGGHDALLNCAGHVREEQGFVDLVDKIVNSVESLTVSSQPVCWFLAGAALLDIGLARLRVSIDGLPVQVPDSVRSLAGPSLLRAFSSLIPQLIVPYADAAALMLANLDRGGAMARRRVGLALPEGMTGRKPPSAAV